MPPSYLIRYSLMHALTFVNHTPCVQVQILLKGDTLLEIRGLMYLRVDRTCPIHCSGVVMDCIVCVGTAE